MIDWICRTFSEPLRAIALKLMPWLPAAAERDAHAARLYAIWDGWIQQMQTNGPGSPDDDSMWACIKRVRDPATGAALYSFLSLLSYHRLCLAVIEAFWECKAMAKLLLSLCTRAVGRQLGIQSPRREVAHVGLQESHWKGTSCKQKSAVSLWAGWTPLPRHAHSRCKFLPDPYRRTPLCCIIQCTW